MFYTKTTLVWYNICSKQIDFTFTSLEAQPVWARWTFDWLCVSPAPAFAWNNLPVSNPKIGKGMHSCVSAVSALVILRSYPFRLCLFCNLPESGVRLSSRILAIVALVYLDFFICVISLIEGDLCRNGCFDEY
jgi:hypothetical protein